MMMITFPKIPLHGLRIFLIICLSLALPVSASPQTLPGLRVVPVQLKGMDHDPISQSLYAASAKPERLLRLDPVTGLTIDSYEVGFSPGRVALGAGRGLWIGLDGSGAVRRFNLNTFTAEEPIPVFEGGQITDLAASEVDPSMLAVTINGVTTFLIRNGQLLPDHVNLQFISLSGNYVYGTVTPYRPGRGLYQVELTPNGFGASIPAAAPIADVKALGDFVFHPHGYRFRTADLRYEGRYPMPILGVDVAIPTETDQILHLASPWQLFSHDRSTMAQTGYANLGVAELVTGPVDLVAWSTNRAAFHSASNLFLLDTAELFAPADIEVSHSSSASVEFGRELTFTVSIFNKGPGMAIGLVLTNFSDPNYLLRSVSTGLQQLSNSFSPLVVSLGNLPAGSTSRVALTVLPKKSGLLTNAIAVGAVNDFTPQNNTNSMTAVVNPPSDGVTRIHLNFADAAYDTHGQRILAYEQSTNSLLSLRLDEPGLDKLPTPFFATPHDMEISPIDSTLLAVSTGPGTALYRNGQPLPAAIPQAGYFTFSEDARRLYFRSGSNCDLLVYAVGPDGLTLENAVPNVTCAEFSAGNGLLYIDGGIIWDPALSLPATNTPPLAPPVFFAPQIARTFDVLTRTNGLWIVRRFRPLEQAYEQFAIREIGAIPSPVLEAFSAGENRLACRTATELLIVELPADPTFLRISIARTEDNQLRIQFWAAQGVRYQIELKSALTSASLPWTPIVENLAGADAPIFHTLTPNSEAAFYRVVRLP